LPNYSETDITYVLFGAINITWLENALDNYDRFRLPLPFPITLDTKLWGTGFYTPWECAGEMPSPVFFLLFTGEALA
jgi:hypothetical protein